jgi:hypothetical protein
MRKHPKGEGQYCKTCQHCGEPFYTNWAAAKFGSGACRMAAHRAAHKIEPEKAYCRWCGKPFYPERGNAMYHSDACKQKAYRARKGAGKQAMF